MAYSYRIEQAIRASSVLHKDQVRKGATPFPYVTHPFAVAMIAADYTNDEEVIIAALLHDTLEDTDYTPEELQDDFGGTVKELVTAVTEQKSDPDHTSRKESKRAYLKQLREAPHDALIVAAADKIHNIRAMVEEFYDDHSAFVATFGHHFEDRLTFYEALGDVLNDRLQNDILTEFNNVLKEYLDFIQDVQKSQE